MKSALAAVALGLAAFAGAAQAVPVLTATGVACDGHGTRLTSDLGYLACSGAWSGNNLNQASAVTGEILKDWSLNVNAPVDVTGGLTGTSGTLHFADQTGLFVISLKAGDAFSLYEFDGSKVAGGISSLSFDTLGVGFYSAGVRRPVAHFGQGLSHADLYSVVRPPVPEPETYALMLAGLAAVGFVARRRAR